MTPTVIAAYIAACVLLAATPGPNMALIIANTLRGGLAAGLATLAGTAAGLTVLVAVAALGMSSVMAFMASWFDVVRWCGAVYLAALGLRQLWSFWRGGAVLAAAPVRGGGNLVLQGLAVSLSNPKVVLFLGAFLPQFVDPAAPAGPQLAVLSMLFVAVLVLVDISYTLGVARARARLDMARLRVLDGVAGALLLAGGALLAVARRP